MSSSFSKSARLILSSFALSAMILTPAAFAVECDQDGDGYVALTPAMMEEVVADNAYNADGNYSAAEWQNIFTGYKANVTADTGLDSSYVCDNLNFKKGAEPARCDSPLLDSSSGVYDTSKVVSLAGDKVNPGAFDTPQNGIDEDCDGADGKYIAATSGNQDLGGLVGRVMSILSKAVVVISIAFMIVGGIKYASAGGDENKTAVARKTIIGAIIGLIVGLLAPTIVNTIVAGLA